MNDPTHNESLNCKLEHLWSYKMNWNIQATSKQVLLT